MIMVFYGGLAEGRKNKNAAGVWRPAAICLVKVLSQPQVRANRAKPIKEILAAGCVVYLLAVHKAKVAERNPQSSLAVPAGKGWFGALRARPSEQNQTLNLNSSTSPSLTT
jgi:hypothetical protein